MPTLTAAQVAGIVANPPAGSTVAEWVNVARLESGFRTDVEDYLGSGHWGLFQISEDHWNKPWNGNVGGKANFVSMLKGANFNWRQAQFLYSEDRERGGTGWRPWVSSIGQRPSPTAEDRAAAAAPDTSVGASGGEAGDPGVAEPGLGISIPNPLDALRNVAEALANGVEVLLDVARWLGDPHNWARILLVVGGGIVVFVGVAALVSGSRAGQIVTSTAATVATKGKA